MTDRPTSPPDPERAPTRGDARRFVSLFQGRRDAIARFWRSRSGDAGFSPVCRNEWGAGCRKGSVPGACRDCGRADLAPLSEGLLRDHFRGRRLLGVYPLRPDGRCRFLAADFDARGPGDDGPLAEARALAEVCAVLELPILLLRSRSGRGVHAFFFFDRPAPAWLARRLGAALLEEAGLPRRDGRFDRFFPSQDRIAGGGLGSLIALPFHGGAARRGHTLPLDPEAGFRRPHSNPWAALAKAGRISVDGMTALLAEWRRPPDLSPGSPPVHRNPWANGAPPEVSRPGRRPETGPWPPADFDRIAARCRFIAHCRDDAATLSEPDWYILLTIAARCKDGRRLAHRLSAPYPRYRRAETEAKIDRALACTGPYRCRTIARINGRFCGGCPHAGRVSSPIRLGCDPPAPDGFSAGEAAPAYGASFPPGGFGESGIGGSPLLNPSRTVWYSDFAG
jgi:hypothetical protein